MINNKATYNVGMIGHVANGKSTISEQIAKRETNVHSNEKEKNITMHMNYANAKIYKNILNKKPECYISSSSYDNIEDDNIKLIKHISLVDCPGHQSFMKYMFDGAWVMDSCFVVMSAEHENIPAPQTIEHLMVIKSMNIKLLGVVLNKCDRVKNSRKIPILINNIKKWLKKNDFDNIPIIPCCANRNINIDILLEIIANAKEPERDITSSSSMVCVRSFDVNKYNKSLKNLIGGAIGGSVIKGIFNKNDKIKIYPGILKKENNKWKYKILETKIISMKSEKNNLDIANPGGLISLGTKLDPSITARDRLIGSLIISENNSNPPKVYDSIIVDKFKNTSNIGININKGDSITINSKALEINSIIEDVQDDMIYIKLLSKPLCVMENDNVSISKKINTITNKIVGYGIVIEGNEIESLE